MRRHPRGRVPSGPVDNRELVQVERRAKIGARRSLLRLQRDAGGIGNPVDRVEEADNTRRVDQSRRAECHCQGMARSGQRGIFRAEHGYGKPDEEPTVRNLTVVIDRANDRFEVVGSIVDLAARTEQQGMAGGSIETSIECGDPRRQQLDLGVADRAVLMREVAHHLGRQVLVGDQVEEAADLVRHQAHRLHDIGRRPIIRVEPGFSFAHIRGLDPWDPSTPRFRASRPIARRRARLGMRQRGHVEAETTRHRIDRDSVGDDADNLDILRLGELAGDHTTIPALAEPCRIG